ncbi:MAG: hypothetical protein D6780_00265 [Candidatus Dadabacteria bacterium]|nr:MAG: hypothetical protein D6780_00265 [Candidatus Dadabacteria bacterium]
MSGNKEAYGRAFFISQGEPVELWQWLSEIIVRNGLNPPKRKLPLSLGKFLGYLFEKASIVSRYKFTPPFTRFLAMQMAHSHYFDISAAKKILGYTPRYSVSEAMEATYCPLSSRQQQEAFNR